MMWKEFEEIAGYEVSYETYSKVIEPMYMALPDSYTKYDFVKMLDKKAFALPTKAQMLKQLRKTASEIRAEVEHTGAYALKEQLRKECDQYAQRVWNVNDNEGIGYFYWNVEYTVPGTCRGCSFPVELVVGIGNHEFERVWLVK